MAILKHKLTSIFFTKKSYIAFGGVAAFFVLSGFLPIAFFYLGFVLLMVVVILIGAEILMLVAAHDTVKASRSVQPILSLGDDNVISILVENNFPFSVAISIIDAAPVQVQLRQYLDVFTLESKQKKNIRYNIKPNTRGEYSFGSIYILATHIRFGFVQRSIIIDQPFMAKVYPSIIQMHQIELISFSKLSVNQGVKRLRRLGHSYEFEQIKAYVQGDDYRSINWKATGRRQVLMLNQFEDERSQPVYFAIDKGRSMKMPFNDLSLIDYAVNSTLAISNVALKKGDKVGLITFDSSIDTILKSSDKRGQLSNINETLYNLQQTDKESSFEHLYSGVSYYVKQRSLIFIYTNCNTLHSLKRIKPALQLLNRRNLVVVILFENSEIVDFSKKKPTSLEEVYENTIAEEFLYDQRQIARELNASGIQTIVSDPEQLSVNTINKYLELKSQGKT